MRNAMIRSLPLPGALLSGSTATRMVLQSCSSSRRKSSGDQGWRKAARSITITSSRSSGRMRRISSLARARTAISGRPFRNLAGSCIERIEHADGGALAQLAEQLGQQPLVLLLRQPRAQLVALGGGQLASLDRLLELAVAELGRQLEAVVEIPAHAQLAGQYRRDLVLGQLDGADEGLVPTGGKAAAQPRQERIHFA